MSSEPPCCAFTYESDRDYGVTRTALGIACSWPDLRKEFFRQGPPCPGRNVLHLRTISIVGPKLFAVNLDNLSVFYNDGYQWHQYESARNVRFGKLKDFREFFYDLDDDTNNDDWSQQDNDGKDQDDDQPGQEVKDFHLIDNSTYRINQAILYYCLLRMLLFIQSQVYLIKYQSFID
jgi:hypothetical protein